MVGATSSERVRPYDAIVLSDELEFVVNGELCPGATAATTHARSTRSSRWTIPGARDPGLERTVHHCQLARRSQPRGTRRERFTQTIVKPARAVLDKALRAKREAASASS